MYAQDYTTRTFHWREMMKRQLTFLGIVIMTGILAMTATSVLAVNVETYEIKFDPYFIGSHQRDNIIVVNHFDAAQPYSLRVMGTAYDPFTGERLDSQTVDVIPAGLGTRVPFTDTHPEPHASLLVLRVDVFYDDTGIIVGGDGIGADVIPDPPFSITRILTTRKDETLLQIKGVPILLNTDTP